MAIDRLRRGEPDRLLLEALAPAIFADALGIVEAGAAPVPAGWDRLGHALDLIEAWLGEGLSMADLAAAAHMSPSWFAQSFRAALDEPVFAHVRRRRLARARARARAMLADSRLSLGATAHACGLANQSHITRGLRRRRATTLARLRRDG